MKFATKTAQAGLASDKVTGAISTPIYQTATFRHPALGQSTGFDYSRSQNPTRQALEETIALLEEGHGGFAFASGMAAITTIFMLYRPGDHIILTEDCYGGTYRILTRLFCQLGISATYVDTSDLQAIRQAIQPSTKAIFLETPTNPLLKIADIGAIAALAKENAASPIQLIVDNTFLSPCLQRPLTLGADIVIHSGSKYLSGHNDVICGLIVTRTAELSEKIRFLQNAAGAILGPQDSWLLIRGIKTLAIRMKEHEKNGLAIARWLQNHPRVTAVYYPGLPGHPGKEIHEKQSEGFGGMLSFTVDDSSLPPQVLEKVRVFQFAESLGGVESLITFPAVQTHADIPAADRHRLGINEYLLRVSVGIEDIHDLITDLDQALS